MPVFPNSVVAEGEFDHKNSAATVLAMGSVDASLARDRAKSGVEPTRPTMDHGGGLGAPSHEPSSVDPDPDRAVRLPGRARPRVLSLHADRTPRDGDHPPDGQG